MMKVASTTPTISPTPATPSTTISTTPPKISKIPKQPLPKAAPKAKQKESKLFLLLPIFSYVFYLIMCVVGTLTVIGIPHCVITAYSGSTAYAMAKTFMYFVFIYRLHVVYSKSMFAYKRKLLWMLFLIVLFCSFVLIIANILTLNFQIVFNVNDEPVCIATTHSAVLFVIIGYDMIVSFLCCYLFIRPLIILNKNEGDKEVRRMVLKYVILTCVSVCTTFLFLILMALTEITSLVTFDGIINCICIALFNKYYSHYYKLICCGPIFVCDKMCAKKNETASTSQTTTTATAIDLN